MKKNIYLLIGLLLFLSISFLSCNRDRSQNPYSEHSITLYSASELSTLTTSWAEVYRKINPDVTINIVDAEDPAIKEDLDAYPILGFTTDKDQMSMFGTSPWKEVVGRDVIVLVVNAANPFMEEISRTGISPVALGKIIGQEGSLVWGNLLPEGGKTALNLYMVDDPSVQSSLAGLLEKDPSGITGNKVDYGNEVIAAVQKDPYAMGVCKIADVLDASGQSIASAIRLLPIDGNANGKIDYKESIYTDLATFSRGVWIGKYPGSLVRDIYTVSYAQPRNMEEVAFLKWILSNGQQLLDNYGFRGLEHNERMAKVSLIDNYDINTPAASQAATLGQPLFSNIFFLAILTVLVIILFLTIAGILSRERRKGESREKILIPRLVFNEEFIRGPRGLYYDRSHTWAFMNKEGMVKIGIDDFLQHVTGPLTGIKLKSPGEQVKKGKHVFSIIQEGKQLDICTPVSGTIREVNKSLIAHASLLNTSPYTDGWVYKIEPTNWMKEIRFLFLGNKYMEWIKNEITRLKEFFAESMRPETAQYANVLQDGGELTDSLLKDFGPEVWEDFQIHFMDVSS